MHHLEANNAGKKRFFPEIGRGGECRRRDFKFPGFGDTINKVILRNRRGAGKEKTPYWEISGMFEKFKINGLEQFSKKELSALYNAAVPKKFKAGDTIIKEGAKDREFYLIAEGAVGVYKALGGTGLLLDVLRPGDWVGEIAMIRQTPRVASARAHEPSLLLSFSPDRFATLPDKVQIHIQKELVGLAMKRLDDLHVRTARSAEKMKKFGVYVDALKTKADDCVASEFVQTVIASVPKLPRFAGGMAARLMDHGISVTDAADAIKGDPSLTALVLKTINSPYYGLKEKVGDINRAFLFLGSNQVYQLVMENSLKSVMPKTEEFDRLLRHSTAVSSIAYEAATAAGRRDLSGAGATVGMLHDMGTAIILLLKRQNPKLRSLLDLLNHAQMGADLLAKWELPEKMCKTIKYHTQPEYLPPEGISEDVRDEVALLHVAHCCADRLLGATEGGLKELFFPEYFAQIAGKPVERSDFYHGRLLPALSRNKKAYPAWLRDAVEKAELEE